MAITMETIRALREATGAGIMDCKKALTETDGDLDKAIDWLRQNGIAKAAKKASRIAAEGLCAICIEGNVGAIVEVNSETDFVAKNESFKALVNLVAKAMVCGKPATMEEANAVVIEGETVANHIIAATSTIGEKISFRRFAVLTKEDNQVFGHYIHGIGGKEGALIVIDGANAELANKLAMQVVAMADTKYVAMDDVPTEIVEHEREIQMASAKNDPKLQCKPEQALKMIIEGKVRKQLADSCLVEQDYVVEPGKKVAQVVKELGSAVRTFTKYTVGEGIEKREENFAEEVMSQIK